MWSKTIVGLLASMFISMSLTINMAYLLPVPIDVSLFIGFVSFFLLWGGWLSYFYSLDKVKQGVKTCVPVFMISMAINAVFYTGVLG